MAQRPHPVPVGFTPNRLLNALFDRFSVSTDAALAEAIGVAPNLISYFRRGVRPFSPGFMVSVMDAAPEITLIELRRLAGMPRVIK